ncbi:hypothetical protein CHS0354_033448, partial [Potamilus streckersoni]
MKDFKALMKGPSTIPPTTVAKKGKEEECQNLPERVRKLTPTLTSEIGWLEKMLAIPQ